MLRHINFTQNQNVRLYFYIYNMFKGILNTFMIIIVVKKILVFDPTNTGSETCGKKFLAVINITAE